MRVHGLIAASLLCAASATTQNTFNLKPNVIEAYWRGGLGPAGGQMLDALYKDDVRYVGNLAPGGTAVVNVTGFVVLLQDANPATPHNIGFEILCEGPPDTPAPSAVKMATGLIPTPAGALHFTLTATFATPFQDPTLIEQTWFYGVALSPNPAFPGDGLSVAMASYDGLGGPTPPTHDNPDLDARNVAWTVDAAGIVAQAPTPRVLGIHLLTAGTVLRVGQDVAVGRTGPNPMFGIGGFYPDNRGVRVSPAYANRLGIGDGIAFRVREFAAPGATAAVLMSTGFSPISGFVVPGIRGAIPLDFTSSLIPLPTATGILMPTVGGEVEAVIAPAFAAAGSLMTLPHVTLDFTALVVDPVTGFMSLSNGHAVHF